MEIAVIIPAYNSAGFLKQCIDSVLAQTHPVSEVIVVDDGSQDNTREVVAAYPHPVRYFWRPNGGVSAARNEGVKHTACPWIAFLDSDDFWLPRKIELQVEALRASPGAALCYTSVLIADGSGTMSPSSACPSDQLWPRLRYQNPIVTSTVLMRRDRLEEAGGFDPRIAVFQDWDLWFRLGPGCQAVAIGEPVAAYRIVPTSLSHQASRMLADTQTMLTSTLLKDLRGWKRWTWKQRAWSAELSRCAIITREARAPGALSLLLRSLAAWPSPFFLPRRWRSLLIYLLRPT